MIRTIERKVDEKVSTAMLEMAKNLRTIANEIEEGKCTALAYCAVYNPDDDTIHRLHASNYLCENFSGYSLLGVIEKMKVRMVRNWIKAEEAEHDE